MRRPATEAVFIPDMSSPLKSLTSQLAEILCRIHVADT
jgi:hypothetical protein